MGWTRCVHCEKSRCDFVAWTFALIAPVYPVLHRVSCSYETLTNAPKHYTMQHNKTLVLGPMEWICCVSWKISRRDIVARTFELIAPVHTVLHRVSCSYETITNEPKHYATHQHMSVGSNGVDWVRSLRKIKTWLRGTSSCINCTSAHCFAPSFMQLWNDPKCTKTLCNAPKLEFRVQWDALGAFVAKNLDVTSWHEL